MRRVVITGMGALTSIGQTWETVEKNLQNRITGIRYMPEWEVYEDLNTKLGGPIDEPIESLRFNRKNTRSMGRVSKFAVRASELALEQAGLIDDPCIKDGRMGCSFGSSTGSTDAVSEFGKMLTHKNLQSINATSYIRMMPQTAVVNMGIFFGLTGRVIPTSTACTSGSQGIGFAYEAIKYGKQKLMLAGGGEELCPSEAAVFDVLFATSTLNERPNKAPKPFDRDRDGLVIGEGAGVFVLEEYEHAKARGAKMIAEIVGFANNSDGLHATRPNSETMGIAMQMALDDAQLQANDISYVSSHATATEQGDIAESNAAQRILGEGKPTSSLKSYLGHTLGASGAIESWACVNMLNNGWYHPTANLENIDERCGNLDYIVGNGRSIQSEFVMNNNFAFGGINTSLIFKRLD